MNSCIVLAAGASLRFGSPKALAKIDTETVIQRLLCELLKSSLDEIVIVLGAHRRAIEPFLLKHKKIKVVYNKDHILGQTSSFKAGLRSLRSSANTLLLPVDFPFVQAQTVDALISALGREKCDILVPTYRGKRGHPPVFAASLNKELLAWPDGSGINEFVHQHENVRRELAVDDAGVQMSFNTQEEFAALLLFRNRSND